MSCDVASRASSPFSESPFEEEWKNFGGNDDVGGLGAIVQFNANFDFDGGESSGGVIDPQLLSNASSPASNYSTQLFNNNENGPSNATSADFKPTFIQDDTGDLSQTSGQDNGEIFNKYPAPTDFNQASPNSTPYFNSIEMSTSAMQQRPIYASSPLRNQLHRRSVSEPPGGIPGNHFQPKPCPPAHTVTFHREGTPLGTPKSQNGIHFRSVPRHKHPYRQQPYTIYKRGGGLERGQLRRSQTQPLHALGGPTSVPTMHQVRPHMQPQMMVQSTMPQPQFVSSRVCTPAPSPTQERVLESPIRLDPALSSPSVGVKRKGQAVAIPVTPEELSAMITDAVQKALKDYAPNVERAKIPEEVEKDCVMEAAGDVKEEEE